MTDSEHESDLRSLMAQAARQPYRSFTSLAEAQRDASGAVILEGDCGGQIYVAIPAHGVKCSESQLEQLLRDLDAIAWPGNDDDMARVVFESAGPGQRVPGGMGGGVVGPEGWVHPEFVELGIADEIRAVLSGAGKRLSEAARAVRRPPTRRPLP